MSVESLLFFLVPKTQFRIHQIFMNQGLRIYEINGISTASAILLKGSSKTRNFPALLAP